MPPRISLGIYSILFLRILSKVSAASTFWIYSWRLHFVCRFFFRRNVSTSCSPPDASECIRKGQCPRADLHHLSPSADAETTSCHSELQVMKIVVFWVDSAAKIYEFSFDCSVCIATCYCFWWFFSISLVYFITLILIKLPYILLADTTRFNYDFIRYISGFSFARWWHFAWHKSRIL